MRCLFVADQPDHFMDAVAALGAARLTTSTHRDSLAAEQAIRKGGFRIVLVGADGHTSEAMTFMYRLRNRSIPVLAVTHDPDLRAVLLDLGAERVVVLPDQEGRLKFTLETLLNQSGTAARRPVAQPFWAAWQRRLPAGPP
jgi:DNA-binding response OmpR family regulator